MGEASVGTLRMAVSATLGPLDLSLELEAEGRIALRGPSGAGKSTILRILAGIERRAEGRIEWAGEPWLDTRAGHRVEPWERGVGWVPQDGLLFPHLSVRENLGYGGAEASEIRTEAERFEVDHLLTRRPRRLSGGEGQRVALARAVLASPTLLLLDEPFAALDPALRGRLAERLREVIDARGIGVVLVSHDADDAPRLGCAAWRLTEGRLVRDPG